MSFDIRDAPIGHKRTREEGAKPRKEEPKLPDFLEYGTKPTIKPGASSRVTPDFIEGFMHYTEGMPTGKLFRLWGGINTILGALTRRVWTISAGLRVYPNLYTFFIGKPGTGKDVVCDAMESLWMSLNDELILAPRSLSPKGLIDVLGEEECSRFYSYTNEDGLPIQIEFRPLIICVPELGTILPVYDPQILSFLNELYGSKDHFEDRVRGRGMVSIINPCVHVVLGTQPDFLGETFRDTAFGMGIFSRLIMVYSSDIPKVTLWGDSTENKRETIKGGLVHDLQQIVKLTGEFKITSKAQELVSEWYHKQSAKDAPTHLKLEHYNSRRILHLLKLCMAFSVSRTNDLVIDEIDWRKAYNTLTFTEARMPEIFASMTSARSDNSTIEEVMLHIRDVLSKTEKPIPESQLVKYLSKKVPSQVISPIIENMVKSKKIRPLIGKNQERFFDLWIDLSTKEKEEQTKSTGE